ncbi:MAG: glycoside hydrolase family 88 protein [Clostridia bacterium]|nr:glycoside hydrolase family 88 protein [Clostridia bacterium]
MEITPLGYAELACKMMMNNYEAKDLPPKGAFFYHQGVFLSGMQNVYYLTGDKKYFDYIKEYIDSVIGENGELFGICHEITPQDASWFVSSAIQLLDCKQPSILLYNLYDETGEEKYMNAIKTIAQSMYFWPVNSEKGYWHMMTQHNQMWLDGAYMAGPLSVMYAHRFGDDTLRERAIEQVFIMERHMKDKNTGLYYHGWDESKEEPWSDKETGLSGQFWGRAIGWYAVAVLDILDYIPDNHPAVERLNKIEADLLEALVNYQDAATGMWYEVIDKIDAEDNWIETSCSCLITYAYAKAVRKGIVAKDKYASVIDKAYAGIIDSLSYDEKGDIVIDNVCIGTCIDSGTYEHYINREKIKNDLHGVGAFILMCAEMQRYLG